MSIKTILLKPPPGSTLLTKCRLTGSRPPVRDWWPGSDGWGAFDDPPRWRDGWTMGPNAERALVLARDGEVQRHGCLTLAQHAARADLGPCEAFLGWVGLVETDLAGPPGGLAPVLGGALPGATLVFLDEAGRDITKEVQGG